jgi:hypothetical protein
MKGFYKCIAIYCHAGDLRQNRSPPPHAANMLTLTDAVKRKARAAIYYCAGDWAVSMKRA